MSGHFIVNTLTGVVPDTADAMQTAVLEDALKQVGFIPNMYANMVNVPGVLSTYLHGYGAFRQHSDFTPAEQEVVFLAISRENDCKYCTAAHSMLADRYSKVPTPVLAAIRAGTPLPEAKLAALFAFTQELVRNAGKVPKAVADAFLAAGYTDRDALQVVLAAAVKTLSNYTNHLFQTAVDEAFAAYAVS
ncbi:MAG: carboxymuconolactone decarboxylase family protein [Gammaproteobacteria bacterium]|nr:carboxymuconolactone decarboxylase family protein [Gammaproteobacteria bacterium]